MPEPLTADGATGERSWAPVVYGRTSVSDTWWRVTPETCPDRRWLADAVAAVVAGGDGLEDAPRFLLAQCGQGRLVGMACMARDISATMHSVSLPGDPSSGGRALYTFVGWFAPPAGEGRLPWVPDLPTVRRQAGRWAAPVYETWLAEVWDTRAASSRRSEGAPPPWDGPGSGTAPAPGPPRRGTPRTVHSGTVRLWPPTAGHDLWDRVRTGSAAAVVTCGWTHMRYVPSDVGADAVVDNLPPDDRRPTPSKTVAGQAMSTGSLKPRSHVPVARRREAKVVALLVALLRTLAEWLGLRHRR
ncbi:hypothetical protein [Streptomyces sp. NPDC001348]